MSKGKLLLFPVLTAFPGLAQTDARYVGRILAEEIMAPQVATFQLKEYLLGRVAKAPSPKSASGWTEESRQLRERILRDVVFHGWPREWAEAPPKFEEAGVVPGRGYRIRKYRYEIVPGFQSAALLYEPENMAGKVPAILNVNGHVGPPGKAVEYKQKRCIAFARGGVMALNLEWFSFGELNRKGNEHAYGAHLDLAGMNELGLFYLAMRKGLDFLHAHPNTDRERLGMTGLSGGGWQTIVLSSLDERVKAAVPVAGFSSVASRVEARRYGDIGDFEQSAADLLQDRDYTHLAALMAPRPTLLIYNAEDDCCFRAPMVKPFIFDAAKPIFDLYGKGDLLSWHENRDPGTHNYQIDNRRQAYRFFSRYFNVTLSEDDDVAAEMKSYDELAVGLPEDNLTILGLARKVAAAITRPPLPAGAGAREAERKQLAQIVRYRPEKMGRAWTVATTKSMEVETRSLLLAMASGLSADGVWLKAMATPESAPVTVVLDDRGKAASAEYAAERINRGEQVLAVDLSFTGDAWKDRSTWLFEQMLYTLGDRPIGLEAAQLAEAARWAKARSRSSTVRVETFGIRNQVTALLAAALNPGMFSEIVVRGGMATLGHVLDKPVELQEAPDLFCLDLLKQTDLDRLAALSSPTTVRNVR